MNPQKRIVSLKGEEVQKSNPMQDEIEALPKKKVSRYNEQGIMTEIEIPDISQLERETVGNVIISCLVNYPTKEKREGFYINTIANLINTYDGTPFELKEKVKSFLIRVLEESTVRVEKEESKDGKKTEIKKGLYYSWVIAQCLEELGINEE